MNIHEQIQHCLDQLYEESIPIIVEGNKDKEALQKLGMETIITLHQPLYKIVEQLSTREVAILTDLDWRGKKLYRKIKHDCIRHGILINDRLRLFLLQETPLCHIEGLGTFLNHLEEKESIPRMTVL